MINSISAVVFAAGRYIYDDDHMDGDWWWMAILMAVFWASVIVLVVWLTKRDVQRGDSATAGTHSPDEILARRLASGEISADEYRSTLAVLRGEPPA